MTTAAGNCVGGWRELGCVVLAGTALTIALTYPIAVEMGHVGRVDNGDGMYGV